MIHKRLIKVFFIILMTINIITYTYANDASVRIVASWSGQVIKAFSSISNLNSNTSPIATLVADQNFETVYNYTTNTSTKIYFKAEISALIEEWGTSEYTLVSWTDNILSLWVWWELSSLVNQLNEIKWDWFVSDFHSLSKSWSWWISSVDKTDIANLVKTKLEESWSLLSQIINLVQEAISRLISIKWDTQKLK